LLFLVCKYQDNEIERLWTNSTSTRLGLLHGATRIDHGINGQDGSYEMLNRPHVTAVFVVEASKPVGVVHLRDVLRVGAA
jgi:deoxycytidine triphosphate deaminase